MKKYSILIVGIKCYSGHLREFIVNLKKKNPQAEITLAVSAIRKDNKEAIKDCVQDIIYIKKWRAKRQLQFLDKLMNSFYCCHSFRKLSREKHYDIVDIHYASPVIKYAMPYLKKMADHVLISPWGSDVMRVDNPSEIQAMRKLYAEADYITIPRDSEIAACAISRFGADPEKFVKVSWGGEFFDFIAENSGVVSQEDAKNRFGLEGKYVITCGYNTQKEQRHEAIIDAIYGVRDRLPDNLVLLFPFTYGRTSNGDSYIAFIKEKCSSLGLPFMAIEDHLDMADLLKLRMATDIFVHVQTTDAGSRCVMEYVYCNRKVVHGAWIKYPYLEEFKPSCYFPVTDMQELGEVIVKACHSHVTDLPGPVITIILERGWNYKMTQWDDFFSSISSEESVN